MFLKLLPIPDSPKYIKGGLIKTTRNLDDKENKWYHKTGKSKYSDYKRKYLSQ